MKNRIISKLNPIDFGALVEELNNEWGLTMSEISEITGINSSYLKDLKSGSRCNDEFNKIVHLISTWLIATDEKRLPFYK